MSRATVRSAVCHSQPPRSTTALHWGGQHHLGGGGGRPCNLSGEPLPSRRHTAWHSNCSRGGRAGCPAHLRMMQACSMLRTIVNMSSIQVEHSLTSTRRGIGAMHRSTELCGAAASGATHAEHCHHWQQPSCLAGRSARLVGRWLDRQHSEVDDASAWLGGRGCWSLRYRGVAAAGWQSVQQGLFALQRP